MPTKKPVTKVMTASQVRQHFAETVNEAAKGHARFVIEKNGAPSAGVVSARDLEQLAFHDAKREENLRFLAEFRSYFADVSAEEIELQFAKDLAEVREEMTRERERTQGKQSEVA